jgi:hypothetical protein
MVNETVRWYFCINYDSLIYSSTIMETPWRHFYLNQEYAFVNKRIIFNAEFDLM